LARSTSRLTLSVTQQFHVVGQQVAQREAAAVDAGLDRAQRDSRHLGYLLVVVTLDVVQHDRRALVSGDLRQRLVDLEKRLKEAAGLGSSVVTPTVSGSADSTLQLVGRAAGNQLLEMLREGDVITIDGEPGLDAVKAKLEL
jgi:hypothetical protein